VSLAPEIRRIPPLADDWYASRDLGAGIFLIFERHVHQFARCNIWYVRGSERDLLVDSGTGLRPLRPALAQAAAMPAPDGAADPGRSAAPVQSAAAGRSADTVQSAAARPIIALATHGHFDHVGALHEFGDRRAHELEAAQFAEMPDALTLAPLFRALDAPVAALPCAGWLPAHYRVPPAPVGASLAEGDRIDLGDRLYTVMHLPGHSPGSLGLYDERNGMLFSGDALYDGELIDDFPTSDGERYRATMERLRALPIQTGHGGHGPSFDERRKLQLIDDYLAGRRHPGCPQPAGHAKG